MGARIRRKKRRDHSKSTKGRKTKDTRNNRSETDPADVFVLYTERFVAVMDLLKGKRPLEPFELVFGEEDGHIAVL